MKGECRMIFDRKIERLGTNSIKWDRYGDPDVLALGTADMDFKSPECVTRALVARAQTGMFAYELKSEEYYQSIIGWYKRRYGYDVRKEWILNGPGVWACMRMCIDTYTCPGDGVLLSSPYFHPAADIIRAGGRVMVTSPLIAKDGRYGFDMEDFERKLEKVKLFILINPQNPTGRVFSRDELKQIGDACLRHGVMIVSDEVHCNVLYDGAVHTPIGMVSDEIADRSVLLTAPSKAFNLQGLTYGICIIPNPALREKFEKTMTGYDFDFATNVFSMTALQSAYNEGEPWLNELTAYLQGNLDFLCEFAKSRMPGVKVYRPEGSYMVWMDFRALNLTAEQLQAKIGKEAKVQLTWGETFGPDGEGFERINIACHRSTLEAALERMCGALYR